MEVIGPATPLCYAAAFGNLEVARFLLKSGARVSLVDVRASPDMSQPSHPRQRRLRPPGGCPAIPPGLPPANRCRHPDGPASRLAARPAQGSSLTTVLHVACYWLEVDVVRLLLAHGADHSAFDAVRPAPAAPPLPAPGAPLHSRRPPPHPASPPRLAPPPHRTTARRCGTPSPRTTR